MQAHELSEKATAHKGGAHGRGPQAKQVVCAGDCGRATRQPLLHRGAGRSCSCSGFVAWAGWTQHQKAACTAYPGPIRQSHRPQPSRPQQRLTELHLSLACASNLAQARSIEPQRTYAAGHCLPYQCMHAATLLPRGSPPVRTAPLHPSHHPTHTCTHTHTHARTHTHSFLPPTLDTQRAHVGPKVFTHKFQLTQPLVPTSARRSMPSRRSLTVENSCVTQLPSAGASFPEMPPPGVPTRPCTHKHTHAPAGAHTQPRGGWELQHGPGANARPTPTNRKATPGHALGAHTHAHLHMLTTLQHIRTNMWAIQHMRAQCTRDKNMCSENPKHALQMCTHSCRHVHSRKELYSVGARKTARSLHSVAQRKMAHGTSSTASCGLCRNAWPLICSRGGGPAAFSRPSHAQSHQSKK